MRTAIVVFLFAATACVDLEHGEVELGEDSSELVMEESSDIAEESADAVVFVKFESPHPYSNNLWQHYGLDLRGLVPACATKVRLHFQAFRTEATYDFVQLIDGDDGHVVQTLDGNHDGLWSAYVAMNEKRVSVRLETDYSVRAYGFIVDKIEWRRTQTCTL